MPSRNSVFPARPTRRSIILPLGLVLVLILQLGCARPGNADGVKRTFVYDALGLEISLDKSTYRPGEPILAVVRLTNLEEAGLTLQKLNAHSLVFYAGSDDTENRSIVEPVFSPRENPSGAITLEPGAPFERTFLFTRLTEFEGPFVMTARYGSPVNRESAVAPDREALRAVVRVVAVPITFSVNGDRAFRRDSAGLLMKDDAIELCRSEAGGTPGELDAVLVRNEAGFLDWWVFDENTDASKREVGSGGRAWIVNPYLGVIRSEAKPPPPEVRKSDEYYRITHRWAGEDPSGGIQ